MKNISHYVAPDYSNSANARLEHKPIHNYIHYNCFGDLHIFKR